MGLLIWSGPGVCRGEFPQDRRIYSRFNEFGALKTLASDCMIPNDSRFNAVRDEA